MSDKPAEPRLYILARRNTPKALGARTCPNCRRELPLHKFKKIRRGGGRIGWLCDICNDKRLSMLRG